MLALTGKAIEGDVLTVVEVIPESLTQQLVWHKYKQNVRYQWYGVIFEYSDMIALKFLCGTITVRGSIFHFFPL